MPDVRSGFVRWWAPALALALPVLVAVRLAGWWPCDVACQGGGWYRSLGGFEVLWGALAAYALLCALALRAVLQPAAAQDALRALLGLLAGVSAFFLLMSAALGLLCPFCLTVHGLVVLLAILLRARWWPWLLLGILGANAAYHHGPVRDQVEPTAAVATSPADPAAATMDANRRRGPVDAPLRLEAVLDLQCPHCAESWSGIARAAAPAIQAGRLRLTLRLVQRRSEPASRDLARWAFAAAAAGPAAHGRYIIALLGVRSGLGTDEIRRAHGEDLVGLDDVLTRHGPAIEALVDADQARIAQLGLRGATPLLVLTDRDGRERGRWAGAVDPVALARSLEDAPEDPSSTRPRDGHPHPGDDPSSKARIAEPTAEPPLGG